MRPAKGKISGIIKHPAGFFGIVVIGIAAFISICGANIRPDKTQNANLMQVSLACLPPGSTADVFCIETKGSNKITDRLFFGGTSLPRVYMPYERAETEDNKIKLYQHQSDSEPTAEFSLTEIETLSGRSFGNAKEALISNSERRTFLLGTDKFGRDYLSRLLSGTLISLTVGLIAVLISLITGVFFGSIAGFYGGITDKLIQWFTNVVWSVPTLLMVMAITLALGKGFYQVFIAVGLTMWVEVARVTRGQILSLREKEYIEAAKVMGFSDIRIIFRHLLPGCYGTLIVISASNFATAILLEAGLSFLGVGAQPPMASWGGMMREHYGYLLLGKPWLALIPGLAISLLVLAFVMLGNAIRELSDVKNQLRA